MAGNKEKKRVKRKEKENHNREEEPGIGENFWRTRFNAIQESWEEGGS